MDEANTMIRMVIKDVEVDDINTDIQVFINTDEGRNPELPPVAILIGDMAITPNKQQTMLLADFLAMAKYAKETE